MISQVELDRILPTVTKPGRYSGHEWNHIRKDWTQAQLKVALAYPDVYEVGMSNLGLAILYQLLNEQDGVLAERVYAPWPDMEAALRQAGLPLYSLESRRSLAEFDWVGFSLQYELNYSNVLNMLDLAGIPLLPSQRLALPDAPLVIGGGTCTYNPEPMAGFFDLFVIGEGEEVVLDLAKLYTEVRRDSASPDWKQEFLLRAANVEGVYVPGLYDVQYHSDGTLAAISPLQAGVPTQVRKRWVAKLPPPPVRPVVPFVEAIHDRAMVEVMRGCKRGCRFCQAGIIYRPVRERPLAEVLHAVDGLLANSGHEEVSLVSLSSTDYTFIEPLVRELSERYADRRVSISLPSLRTDAFSVELARIIQRTRKSGLTFAPEAGSERLRAVINKGVTADDLLSTAATAFANGWLRIKLYFMLGLPTETLEDVLAIADLVHAVREIGQRERAGRTQVSVSVNTFVPKPHTPFQWLPLQDAGTVHERQWALRDKLRSRAIKLRWSDDNATGLEAALSRGDRRLAAVILRAWQLGARFDAWSEWLRPELWQQAFAESGLDPLFYSSRTRLREEILPWSHINAGVSETFLWDEYERALREEPSVACGEGCMDCGIRTAFDLERCPQPAEGGR